MALGATRWRYGFGGIVAQAFGLSGWGVFASISGAVIVMGQVEAEMPRGGAIRLPARLPAVSDGMGRFVKVCDVFRPRNSQ